MNGSADCVSSPGYQRQVIPVKGRRDRKRGDAQVEQAGVGAVPGLTAIIRAEHAIGGRAGERESVVVKAWGQRQCGYRAAADGGLPGPTAIG